MKANYKCQNGKLLKKGFARSPVICSTDCSNSSFLQQVDSILLFVGYSELHITLQYVRYG